MNSVTASLTVSSLADLSACEAAALVRARRISPVDLLEDCLARIEVINPALNAVVGMKSELARAQAREAERALGSAAALGPLHGLPCVIKDLNDVEGFPSTFGSRLHSNRIATGDDAVAHAIRQGGATIVGKSNTPEYGSGAITRNDVYGITNNPYDTTLTTGGSSGGAAAALRASLVPVANGSDFGGSLRIPAAFCGVVGLRPTPGSIAFDDRSLLWSPLVVEGPMGRTVADTRLLYNVMCQSVGADPLRRLGRTMRRSRAGLSELRIGITPDLGICPVSSAVRSRFDAVVGVMEGWFASVEEFCPAMDEADEAYRILRGFEYVANHAERLDDSRSLLGENIVWNTELGLGLDVTEIAWAWQEAGRLFCRFVSFFSTHDLLVLPTTSVAAFPTADNAPHVIDGQKLATYYSWFALTYLISLSCHPAVSLPAGMIGSTPFVSFRLRCADSPI